MLQSALAARRGAPLKDESTEMQDDDDDDLWLKRLDVDGDGVVLCCIFCSPGAVCDDMLSGPPAVLPEGPAPSPLEPEPQLAAVTPCGVDLTMETTRRNFLQATTVAMPLPMMAWEAAAA